MHNAKIIQCVSGSGPYFLLSSGLQISFPALTSFLPFQKQQDIPKSFLYMDHPGLIKTTTEAVVAMPPQLLFFVSFHITHIQKPISKMPTCFYPHKQKYDGSIFMLLFLTFFVPIGSINLKSLLKIIHISVFEIMSHFTFSQIADKHISSVLNRLTIKEL